MGFQNYSNGKAMIAKLERAQALEVGIFEVIASGNDSDPSISSLFSDINDIYFELIHSSDDASYRYAYLRFLLRYMSEHSKNTFTYIEQMILETWSDTVENADFPSDIESSIFDVIQKDYIENYGLVALIANKLFKSKQYEEAASIFSVLEDKLNTVEAWNNWAACYAMQNKYKRATEVITLGFNKSPSSALLGNNRGYYLYKDNKFKLALEQLQTVVDMCEQTKYTDDSQYIYAVTLKVIIYREQNMPLQAFFEYGRLSTAGNCKHAETIEQGHSMLSFVENL